MTISKLIPAFYVATIEGSAATLKHLIGTSHKIKSITISSRDMKNDLDANASLSTVFDSFKGEVIDDVLSVNPDFFPSTPSIDVTPEMEAFEEKLLGAHTALTTNEPGAIAVAITRRFDDWGDFVSIKREITGSDFSIRGKVAVHPRRYVEEKSNEKQEYQEQLYGLKFGDGRSAIH